MPDQVRHKLCRCPPNRDIGKEIDRFLDRCPKFWDIGKGGEGREGRRWEVVEWGRGG